ncbi:hypothetical protein AAFN60_05250 [Roseibacillus persicicus]|uniref:hypothetical protein n=1 Tax=Roseibacillus persicicus TaxID=454148 RepID=UPI00398B600D
MAEGNHRFRVQTAGSSVWSAPAQVTSHYMAREKVNLLLLLGGLVVLATGAAIVHGHLTSRSEPDETS